MDAIWWWTHGKLFRFRFFRRRSVCAANDSAVKTLITSGTMSSPNSAAIVTFMKTWACNNVCVSVISVSWPPLRKFWIGKDSMCLLSESLPYICPCQELQVVFSFDNLKFIFSSFPQNPSTERSATQCVSHEFPSTESRPLWSKSQTRVCAKKCTKVCILISPLPMLCRKSRTCPHPGYVSAVPFPQVQQWEHWVSHPLWAWWRSSLTPGPPPAWSWAGISAGTSVYPENWSHSGSWSLSGVATSILGLQIHWGPFTNQQPLEYIKRAAG